MDRLTTDNPETNLQALLNYAYAKDKAVHLAFGNGEDNIPLHEYIAHEAGERGCPKTGKEVMDGGCLECDCPIAILNAVAIQAAELRGRLKMIEDILGDTYDLDHLRELMEAEREERLWIAPCKMKTPIHMIVSDRNSVPVFPPLYVATTYLTETNLVRAIKGFGETVFLTRKEAEAALAKIMEDRP